MRIGLPNGVQRTGVAGALALAALGAALLDQPRAAAAAALAAAAAAAWSISLQRRDERLAAETQRALKESAGLAEAILGAIPSGLIVLDGDGRVCRWNESATRILGMGRGGIIGQHVTQWPIAGQRELARLLQDAREGSTTVRGSLTVERTDGKRIPLGISTSRIAGVDGQDCGAVGVFQDLTEAQRLQARMKQQERLAAIGTLAASIAHEIRNPLASIAGSVELLAGELTLKGEHAELFGLIMKESDRLNLLITDFLEYARERRPEIAPRDPAALSRDVLQALRSRPEAGPGLQISLRAAEDLTPVWADAGMLKQLLLNLVLNACQAMDWRGHLQVALEPWREGGADGLELRIADTGPGVPREHRRHIFEPFFTTRVSGTGLGLAIAHRVAEIHGGHLELLEDEGPGAVFRFRMPAHFATAQEEAPEPIAAPDGSERH